MPGGIHPPLDVIRTWPTPDGTDPVTRSDVGLIVCIIFMALTTLVVSARLYARAVIQRKVGADDYFIIAALFFTIGMGVAICLGIDKYGFDRHVWSLLSEPERLEKGRITIWVTEATNLMGTALTKISILLFVKRMTHRSVNSFVYWTIWATIIFVALSTLIFEITLFAECQPFDAFWKQVNIRWLLEGHQYKCLNEGLKLLLAGIISAMQDFLVTTLPIFIVWNLQLRREKKIALVAIFAVGYLVCAIGVARVVYTHIVFFETYDVTWETHILLVLVHVELHLGIICASVPALKILSDRVEVSRFTSKFSNSLSKRRTTRASKSLGSTEDTPYNSHNENGLYTQELYGIDNGKAWRMEKPRNTIDVVTEISVDSTEYSYPKDHFH